MLGHDISLTIFFFLACFGALSLVVSIIALFAKGIDAALDRWQQRQYAREIARLYKF